MGCGKTTLGTSLAHELDLPFADLDQAIEDRTKKSISDIFESNGEKHFRACEAQVLRDLLRQYKEGVIATGGGAPLFYDNMSFMNSAGITIFLDIDIHVLTQRLAHQRAQRPLLLRDDWETFLAGLAEQRRKVYEQAQVQVKITSNDTTENLHLLLDSLPQVVGH